jgi:putative tryptophan/tyrosine transport system substrate-binding protein
VKRREFIALLGGAAAFPCAVYAQQRLPRIGVLTISGPDAMGPFREALRDLGYIEGRTIQIEMRSAEGRLDRLPELAAGLVRDKVDGIVASQTPAVLAAKNAIRDIPIVMGAAGDPIATGLVASLARPEANVTGLSATSAELAAKNLELVREILPNARRVGVVGNSEDRTFKELGYDLVASTWFSFSGPKGMPKEIVRGSTRRRCGSWSRRRSSRRRCRTHSIRSR